MGRVLSAHRVRVNAIVRPGEGVRVTIMLVYSAAAVGGVFTVGYNGAAMALFLSRLPSSDTPYAFIFPGISIVLTLLLYNRLAGKLWLPHLAMASSAVLAVVGLVFRVLLSTRFGHGFPVLAGIFLYCETASSVVIVQFWTFAGQIFDPREARRLFGLVAAGGTVSGILAGLGLATLTRMIGVDNLLLEVVAAIVTAATCAFLLGRHVRALSRPDRRPGPRAHKQPAQPLLPDLGSIWRSPLLRAVGLLTVLLSLLINIGAYQYFLALQTAFSGRDQSMAVYLGGFAFWTGIAALAVQVAITRPVMVRYGPFAALLFFPVAMAVSGGFALASWGALWAMTLTRACDPALRRTINEASLNVLYLPVSPELRQRSRSLLEGVYALTFALAGVVFLIAQTGKMDYQYWSLPVLFLAAGWVALLLWARRTYTQGLALSVTNRRLDFTGALLVLEDASTAGVLARELQSTDERRVVHVLQIIAEASGTVLPIDLARLLQHPSVEVRVLALQYLSRTGGQDHSQQIRECLQADQDIVRAAAIEALWSCARSDAAHEIAPWLTSAEPRTMGAAVTGTLRYGDSTQRLRAARQLGSMLNSGDPDMRREAARILGKVGGWPIDPKILSELGEGLTSFSGNRYNAGIGSGEVAVAHLATLLRDRETRACAFQALLKHGSHAVRAMDIIAADLAVDRGMRLLACRVLQRIERPESAEALFRRLSDSDAEVRAAAFRALAEFRSAGHVAFLNAGAVHTQIQAEVRECYGLHAARFDLADLEVESPLLETLRQRMERALDRILLLLGLLHPDVGSALAHLPRSAARGYHNATLTELLDNVATRELRDLVLPLLEEPEEKIVQVAVTRLGMARLSAVERLVELSHDVDPWLRACAVAQIGVLTDPLLMPTVMRALTDGEPIVCEAALAACKRLLEPAQWQAMLSGFAEAPHPFVVRRYARALLAGPSVA